MHIYVVAHEPHEGVVVDKVAALLLQAFEEAKTYTHKQSVRRNQ